MNTNLPCNIVHCLKNPERYIKMLKIFHTADIHLDAPFSLTDPVEAEKRRTGLRSTFCSMIHAARRMEADVFLIAGDLFEDSFATKDTASAGMAGSRSCHALVTRV